MKLRTLLVALGFCLGTALWSTSVLAQTKDEKKPAEKPAEKPADKPADKPAAPAAKPAEPPAAKPADKPATPAPAAPAVAKPADKPATPPAPATAKPADKPATPAPTAPAAAKPAGDKPAAGGAPDPEMEAWIKAATPGAEHARLKALAGNWTTAVKMWMAAEAPPEESTGTSEGKWIHGDRFVQSSHTGQAMGQPFTGLEILGYDNVKKKYVSNWTDSMGTGMMMSVGTWDEAAKAINYSGEYEDPISGKPKKVRAILKITSNDKHTFEMYDTGKDGKEFKSLEVAYTRK
jgi:hypothetical protein